MRGRRDRLVLVLVVALSGVTCVGCQRGPVMYHVNSVVHYTDGTVPKGSTRIVQFVPADDTTAEIKKGATAEFGPDGSFELSTRKPGDGAYNGEYFVTFAIKRSDSDTRSAVHPKNSSKGTTPYKVTVDRNINDLKFELEPQAAGPAPGGGGAVGPGGQPAGG